MRKEDLLSMLLIIFMIIMFLGWYIYIKMRNKERMALIEKDKDVSGFYVKGKNNFSFPWLKIGIIATGFSVGWIVAVITSELVLRNNNGSYIIRPEPVIMGILFLFTSVSILLAYFIDKKKKED